MPRAAGNKPYYEFFLNGGTHGQSIRFTSVTTILHSVFGAPQYVVDWAANTFKDAQEMRDYRDQRSEEGTETHEWVERYIAAKEGDKPEATTGYHRAFERYVAERNPSFGFSEAVVVSSKLGYAGTLDIGLIQARGTRIVDVKTKKKTIYKAYDTELLQCRAYAMAAYEMGLITRPDGDTGVLILKENGRYTFDDRSVRPEAWTKTLDLYKELYGETVTYA